MAALSTDRRILAKFTQRSVALDVAAGARIFHGAAVARNAEGYAVPATGADGERVIGVAHEAVDNTDGADGEARVRVHKGTFAFEISTANPVTRAQLGETVFAEDDRTVAAVGTVPMGVVDAVEDRRAWVYIA